MSLIEVVLVAAVLLIVVRILTWGGTGIQNAECMTPIEKSYIYIMLGGVVIVSALLIGAVVNIDEVVGFDTDIDRIITNTNYNVTAEEFIENIERQCGDVEEVEVVGIIKYDEDYCVKYVFKHTEEKYMFLNGVTP